MVMSQLRLHMLNQTVENKQITRSKDSKNRGDVTQPQRREWGRLVSLI
jgi:hypothetical protein